MLEQLPFFEDPTMESEKHALTECPGYHYLRLRLVDNLKSLIMLKAYKVIISTLHLEEFGKYVIDSSHLRSLHPSAKSTPTPILKEKHITDSFH
jgi:hypothetical protein